MIDPCIYRLSHPSLKLLSAMALSILSACLDPITLPENPQFGPPPIGGEERVSVIPPMPLLDGFVENDLWMLDPIEDMRPAPLRDAIIPPPMIDPIEDMALPPQRDLTLCRSNDECAQGLLCLTQLEANREGPPALSLSSVLSIPEGICSLPCSSAPDICQDIESVNGREDDPRSWSCLLLSGAAESSVYQRGGILDEMAQGEYFYALCLPPPIEETGSICSSCTDASDCDLGFTCLDELCVPPVGFCGHCIDEDRDGFGLGHCERSGVDCDDEDSGIYFSRERLSDPLLCQADFDINCNGVSDEFEFPNLLDCNQDPRDGCEINRSNDLENCGACDQPCVLDHASALCRRGQCEIDRCDLGWLDEDRRSDTGCEAPQMCEGDPPEGTPCGVNSEGYFLSECILGQWVASNRCSAHEVSVTHEGHRVDIEVSRFNITNDVNRLAIPSEDVFLSVGGQVTAQPNSPRPNVETQVYVRINGIYNHCLGSDTGSWSFNENLLLTSPVTPRAYEVTVEVTRGEGCEVAYQETPVREDHKIGTLVVRNILNLNYRSLDQTTAFYVINLASSGTNAAIVTPNSSVSLHITGAVTPSLPANCPNCVAQVYTQIQDDLNLCLTQNNTSGYFDHRVDFTAPAQPGIYWLRPHATRTSMCVDDQWTVANDFLSAIGVLVVAP